MLDEKKNEYIEVNFDTKKLQLMSFDIKATWDIEPPVTANFTLRVDCIEVKRIESAYIASRVQHPSVFPWVDPNQTEPNEG